MRAPVVGDTVVLGSVTIPASSGGVTATVNDVSQSPIVQCYFASGNHYVWAFVNYLNVSSYITASWLA